MSHTKRILVNGFGRVGRALFRLLETRKEAEVAAINDPLPADQLAYLLKYDTVMGRFPGEVSIQEGALMVNGRRVALTHCERLSARELSGCDVVVNSSGRNNTRENLETILEHGADRVFVSKPLSSGVADRTILMGVNQQELQSKDRIISAGSCTAHCYAPILKTLHERWQVQRGYMMTVHAYTSAQNMVDGGHERDPRRGRAGAQNIVPTTTESLVSFEQVMPELAGRISGMAQRVPVVNGSNVELVIELEGNVGVSELNDAIKQAAEGAYKGVIEYSADPLVSSDIVGNPHSSIYDSQLTHVQPNGQSTLVRIIAWYDNEWGYANRLAELLYL
ncbi:MAG: type I glyceraldehyde-3-phosphate dehydrogenase [Planctomycetes bacterium]|nr:type I glyceraldehyde-3-phosphate dehydrogenase [Planctomycetota bacterium]